MKTYIQLLLVVASCIVSCSVNSKDKRLVIERAKSIQSFPVSRSQLITTFNLDSIQSERMDGSVRGGRMIFIESWMHPSGLKVTGYTSEHVGPLTIKKGNIDEIVNRAPPPKGVAFGPPRMSFEGFSITSGDTLLYQSKSEAEPQR